MSKLRISEDLALPQSLVTSTIVAYGGKGMGKTNLGAVLVEELTAAGLRWAWLDPLGVSYGLRHSADGKGPGVECLILGGPRGDVPIEPAGGAAAADVVVEESVNVLIDFSRKPNGEMWSVGEKIRFVTAYAHRLFQRQGEQINGRKREPLFQVLDEAARYIPQAIRAGDPEIAKCVGAWEQLVEEGRNVGLGVGLLTQRSARMAKSVSELADAMFAFRTVGPNSLEAVLDWLGEHVEKGRIKDLAERVRSLERGEALVVSPGWLKFEGVVKIRLRHTFDSSATPKAGERARVAKGEGAKPNLDKIRERMAATIERAKADNPLELRKRIASQDRAIADLTADLMKKTQPAAEPKTVEKLILKDAQIKRLEAAVERLSSMAGVLGHAMGKVEDFKNEITAALRAAQQAPAGPTVGAPHMHKASMVVGVVRPTMPSRPAPVVPRRAEPLADGERSPAETKMGRAMLTLLAQRERPFSKAQILTLTGYRSSGPVSTMFADLARAGFVRQEHDGKLSITPDGLAALGDFTPLPTGSALREHLLRTSPQMERRFLEQLFAAYPEPLSKGQILEATGYKSSGPVSTTFARLVTMGYAVASGPSMLSAAEELFS